MRAIENRAVKLVIAQMQDLSMEWRAKAHRHREWADQAEEEADLVLARLDKLVARVEREERR
jgi:hypothetical protein